jgi:hypothetical protein
MSFRSLKESRRFERVSSDEVRDHIDSRWYELVLGCGGEEQLAASVFSPRYRSPSRSRGTRHRTRG